MHIIVPYIGGHAMHEGLEEGSRHVDWVGLLSAFTIDILACLRFVGFAPPECHELCMARASAQHPTRACWMTYFLTSHDFLDKKTSRWQFQPIWLGKPISADPVDRCEDYTQSLRIRYPGIKVFTTSSSPNTVNRRCGRTFFKTTVLRYVQWARLPTRKGAWVWKDKCIHISPPPRVTSEPSPVR